MLVGSVVTSLKKKKKKKHSVESLLSHDGDLKGFGFGFQRRLGPVITPAMFPPQKASRAASRRGARLQPSPVTCWGPAGGGLGGAARPRRPPAVRGLRDGAGGPGRAGPGWAAPGRAPTGRPPPAWRKRSRRLSAGELWAPPAGLVTGPGVRLGV